MTSNLKIPIHVMAMSAQLLWYWTFRN